MHGTDSSSAAGSSGTRLKSLKEGFKIPLHFSLN